MFQSTQANVLLYFWAAGDGSYAIPGLLDKSNLLGIQLRSSRAIERFAAELKADVVDEEMSNLPIDTGRLKVLKFFL